MADAKQMWALEHLRNWEHNPRTITDADTERLKKQLLNLGQYKPLIVVLEGNGIATVLGGNMRLTALHQLVSEGHEQFKKVWVSPVEAADDKRKLEYALSDNDRAGQYKEDELVELVRSVGDDFEVMDYHIDTAYHIGLDTLGERYDMADVRARGDEGRTGPADRSSVKDAKEIFDNAAIKQIVLYFANKEYGWMLDLLERIQDEAGVQNNTEAVVLMAKQYEENNPSQE